MGEYHEYDKKLCSKRIMNWQRDVMFLRDIICTINEEKLDAMEHLQARLDRAKKWEKHYTDELDRLESYD